MRYKTLISLHPLRMRNGLPIGPAAYSGASTDQISSGPARLPGAISQTVDNEALVRREVAA